MLRSENSVDNDHKINKIFSPKLKLVINGPKIEQGRVETRNKTAFDAYMLD